MALLILRGKSTVLTVHIGMATASFHSGFGQRWDERARTADVLGDDDGASLTAFKDLLLPASLLAGLDAAGYAHPSPVQARALPIVRLGVDVLVQAKSGTGKTLVFAVAALQAVQPDIRAPQVLIIAPTREIAVQINDVISAVGKFMDGVSSNVFIGGMSEEHDAVTAGGTHICVGTAGRLALLMRSGALPATLLKLVVLDEADKLMDKIFADPLRDIFALVPSKKQVIACSATFPSSVRRALDPLLRDPQLVQMSSSEVALAGVRQYYRLVDVPPGTTPARVQDMKARVLLKLLDTLSFHQCIVFLNSRGRAAQLAALLSDCGWAAANISGGQEQQQRLQAMSDLRQFRVRVLVSTDLIARGVDMERVNVVINVDVPPNEETYMHRVGRTGRFGSLGVAVTIVTEKEMERLDAIRSTYAVDVAPLEEGEAIPAEQYDYAIAAEEEAKAVKRLATKRPAEPLSDAEIEQRLAKNRRTQDDTHKNGTDDGIEEGMDDGIDDGGDDIYDHNDNDDNGYGYNDNGSNERQAQWRPFIPPDLLFDLDFAPSE